MPSPFDTPSIAAWAQQHGFPYLATPDDGWYRAWEPFWSMISPIRYLHAVRAQVGPETQVVLVEPWYEDHGLTPTSRALLAFVSHPALQHRAAARLGAGPLSRVVFLGERPPKQQFTGDPAWDEAAATFADTPLEAVRAFTPSLRKLLLSWSFEGHLEIKHGGLVLHVASAQAVPHDYSRVLRWVPMVVEKALKERP